MYLRQASEALHQRVHSTPAEAFKVARLVGLPLGLPYTFAACCKIEASM